MITHAKAKRANEMRKKTKVKKKKNGQGLQYHAGPSLPKPDIVGLKKRIKSPRRLYHSRPSCTFSVLRLSWPGTLVSAQMRFIYLRLCSLPRRWTDIVR